MPQNTLAKDYYHISIIKMMKRMFKPNLVVGERMKIEDFSQTEKTQFSSFFKKMKMLRWPVFFLVEELAGLSKSWKTKEFDQFIDDFDPDLIFGTLPDNPLISNLMLYVKNRKNIPLVTYPWDDYYSLHHSNLSPIFWIRKMMQRHYLYKTAQASEFLYVISNLMKDEYELAFKKDCRLMFKGYNFDASKTLEKKKVEYTIQLVYMGNIGAGRWKTLALLASAIRDINVDGPKMMLNIYTLSPTDDKMKAALNIDGTSRLNLPVPNEKKQKVMDGADILLHVEPFKKSEYQFYRASFSTKLVDYFYSAKCILAVGGMTASTDYLVRNDAAICITDKCSIKESLMKIVDNPQLINEYAKKSWNCGLENHQIDKIQTRMYNDFKSLLSK